MIKKLITISLFVLLIFLTACGQINNQKTITESNSKIFKIGFIGPLSGEINYGVDFLESTQLAVDELNNHDHTIELIVEDGKCNGKDTISSIQKLINIDKVDILVGLVCTTEAKTAKPLIEKERIFSSTVAIAPGLAKDSQYLFTLTPSLSKNVQKIFEHLKENNYYQIAILHAGTDATLDLSKYTKLQAENYNLKIIINETYSSQRQNFSSQLLKIKKLNPDALIIYPQGFNAPNIILKEIKTLNWDIQVLGEETLMAAIMADNFSPATEGVIVSSVMASFDEQRSKYQEFKTKFNQKFGKDPIYTYYQAVSYDTIHLINQALQAGFRTSEQLKNYFENLPEYYGASGRVELDNHERVLNIEDVSLLQVKGGEFVAVE